VTIPAASQRKVEDYLKSLHRRLRGLADARDFVEEIRSHITEKTAAGDTVDTVLERLGNPGDLASQYVTEELLARAQVTRSPWLMLRSLFHWATLSFAGFWILLLSLIGYGLGGSMALCSLLKPIHPATAGLWLLPGPAGDLSVSLRLGFGSAPLGGRELLGWWMVPLGLALGLGMVLITFRLGLWSIRRFRPKRRITVS
jgi:hypothetical protein